MVTSDLRASQSTAFSGGNDDDDEVSSSIASAGCRVPVLLVDADGRALFRDSASGEIY